MNGESYRLEQTKKWTISSRILCGRLYTLQWSKSVPAFEDPLLSRFLTHFLLARKKAENAIPALKGGESGDGLFYREIEEEYDCMQVVHIQASKVVYFPADIHRCYSYRSITLLSLSVFLEYGDFIPSPALLLEETSLVLDPADSITSFSMSILVGDTFFFN